MSVDEKRTVEDVLGVSTSIEKVLADPESKFWKKLDEVVVGHVKRSVENVANNLVSALNKAMEERDQTLSGQLNEAIQFAMSNIGRLDLEVGALLKTLFEKATISKEELDKNFEEVKRMAIELAKKAAEDQAKKTQQEISSLESLSSKVPDETSSDNSAPSQ